MKYVTRAQKNRAMAQFSAWRDEGVPMVVTAHEAHRLSNGIIGTDGDHTTTIPLARVAVAVQA